MKTCNKKFGFTLIEVLLVVALIVILVSLVVGVAKRIDDQGKERLCRNTLALIDNALEQFRDFGYEYKDANFAAFNFPLDCNDYPLTRNILEPTIRNALNIPLPAITGVHDPNFSGSEGLYFFLSQVPDCRMTIDKIDKSLVTNLDGNRNPMIITVNGINLPLMRFIDPWGKSLHYDYYEDTILNALTPDPAKKKTFPVVTSAGADKRFGTNDDIINRQGK